MLLSLCLLILDFLVFQVGFSGLSGSSVFSQHHTASSLLSTEGDSYLLHISAFKRDLISAAYIFYSPSFPYQKLQCLFLCLLLPLASVCFVSLLLLT